MVDTSGLRGRGGAGFPTGRKASFLPTDRKPAYLCVNADESEPGTFKDREIMLRNPHALIEGIVIMSFAIGATSAFIYIRGEYRTEFEVLMRARERPALAGTSARNVLGSGYDATIVLHRGAGAYICGEETALLSSLEGERGQPRSKPPFPAVAGLYASPTLVNNVETICHRAVHHREGRRVVRRDRHRALEGHARLLAGRATSSAPATTSCR